ncbi:acyltransferase family protein [Haemophilus paracuniculus]|uniref:acyltransferase family protein n=1 Tax=Haemophilus paracuniculus TaxID=734 RepID=UPI002481C323|nr:acyltransferase family protein [Haemophilus paracuniculus]
MDLLKIISMLMIIILHLEGHGGLLASVKYDQNNLFFSNYSLAWLLEILAFGAVNCYAIASGYLSWNSQQSYAKLAYFWLQILFYSLIITFLFSLYHNISIKEWISSFFPITHRKYWYASAYFGLFLLMPILNIYLQKVNKNALKVNLIVMLVLIVILPTYFKKDPYIVSNGYSVLWLGLMYLVGGYLAKFGINLKKEYAISLFIFFSILTWLNKIVVEYFNNAYAMKIEMINLISYTSPTIVFAALCLVIFCTQIKIASEKLAKLIILFSSASFGVYLIHEHNLVRSNFIVGISKTFAQDNVLLMLIKIIGIALLIFILCALIDIQREKLFKKLGVLDKLRKIEQRFKQYLQS